MSAELDLSATLNAMEHELCNGRDPGRREAIIRILERWKWDMDLQEASRKQSHDLLRKYPPVGQGP